MQVWSLCQVDALEEEMAPHSSVLAWRIPGTGEPGGLSSMGLQSRTQLKWLSKLPCPSPTPGVHPNSCPSSWWCHPTISSSVSPLFLLPSVFPSIRFFASEAALCIRWPKYWSFSFSLGPSSEYSVLISFRIDWFLLLDVLVDPCHFWLLSFPSC